MFRKTHSERMLKLGREIGESIIKGMESAKTSTRRHVYGDRIFHPDMIPMKEITGEKAKMFITQNQREQAIAKVMATEEPWIDDQVAFVKKAAEMTGFTVDEVVDTIATFAQSNNGSDSEEIFQDESRSNHTIIDPLTKKFTDTVHAQQQKVLMTGKYQNPIHKDNHTAKEWSAHQREELADALVYHECMEQTIDDVLELLQIARDITMDNVSKDYIDRAIKRLK